MSEQHPTVDASASPVPAPYQSTPPQPPVAQYGQHAAAPFPAPIGVAPKNPGIALVVSFFIPGLGTLMNGQTGKGIGIFVGYFISWCLALVLIGIPFAIGFWIWGMVDAYQGAQKWNASRGILS